MFLSINPKKCKIYIKLSPKKCKNSIEIYTFLEIILRYAHSINETLTISSIKIVWDAMEKILNRIGK